MEAGNSVTLQGVVSRQSSATEASRASRNNHDEIPTVVKKEYNNENEITCQELHVGHSGLWEDAVSDVGFFVKQEGNFVMKTEDDMQTVMIKQEMDIGPMLLLPSTALHSQPMSTLEDDFVVKTEDETEGVMVKQEMDIGPTLLQPSTALRSQPLSTLVDPLNPRPNMSSADDLSSTQPCLVFTRSAPAEVEDFIHQRTSGVSSRASLVADVGSGSACWKRIHGSHEPNDRCSGDCTSMYGQEMHPCRYCIKSQGKCDCAEKASKIDSTTPTGRNKDEYRHSKCSKPIQSINNFTKCANETYIHREEKPKNIKQRECGASRVGQSKIHTDAHTGENLYECERCEYSTDRLGALKVHMRIHTEDKPYKCEQCNYGTSYPGSLKIHRRLHTSDKSYKCELCSYSTHYSNSLKIHMRIHTGEKPYRCELCMYSASYLGSLKAHTRTHIERKPFKCKQCEYSTYRLGDLNAHMRIHTGKNLYECGQCEFGTSELGHLTIHVRTHTGRVNTVSV